MKIEITRSEIMNHLGVQINLIHSLLSRPDPFLTPCLIEKMKSASAFPREFEAFENTYIFSNLHRFINRLEAAREKITIHLKDKSIVVTADDLKQYIAKRYPNLKFDENLAGLLLSQCSSTIEELSKKALRKEGREAFYGARSKRPFMRKYAKKILAEPEKIEIELE
ncbi:MAG: hypothetical protein QXQ02_08775 [Halobacteria archaeon]